MGAMQSTFDEGGMKRLPLHGLKNAMKGGKLLFPHLRQWKMTLFSEELRLGEKQGLYEYEPIDGLAF